MKKIYKLFMAVAAVATVGCTTDVTEDLGVKVGGPTTLTLSLDDTRTQLGEKADGIYPLTWAAGDAISVNGSVSNALTADEAGDKSATFTFGNGFGSAPYFIAYPAVEGTTNQVVFAAEQTHTSNTTFGNGAAVMYGYATDLNSVKLNHLTGVLKIGVVSGTTTPAYIKEVRISTVDRKPIAGAFDVDEEGKLTATEGATEVITYKAASDAGFPVPAGTSTSENPAYIHVAVPAGTYGELYVTLESADGVMYKTVTTDSTKPLNAGKVREFSDNIEFVPTDKAETFVIADYSDLYEFREAVEGGSTLNAVLVNDVEMPGVDDLNYPAWEPINAPSYTGTITGNGYAIKGLYAPLFNVTAASFKGLHLVANVEEKSNPNFGAFARKLIATTNAPTVENCSVSGTITINTNFTPANADAVADGAIAGFAGCASGVHFEDCVNNANITINQLTTAKNMFASAAGFVGYTNVANSRFVTITNCVNNGSITINDNSEKVLAVLGGIIASYYGAEAVADINNCSNNGNITVGENAKIREARIGGILAYIKGASSAVKNINFTNETTNNGNIELKGTISGKSYVGGIIGFDRTYNTIVVKGKTTNNGSISSTNTSGTLYIGGILGYMNDGCVFNMDNYVTNGEKATISVSGTVNGNCYLGGIVAVATREESSGQAMKLRVEYKTVTNEADITFSGTCTGVCRLAGYIGYSYNNTSYFNHTGRFINNGTMTVTETADIGNYLELAGCVGYVNGYNMSAGSGHTGQMINNGDLYYKGKVTNDLYIGGIFARQWTSVNSLALVNTGNIYAIGKFNAEKATRVGGIVGGIGAKTIGKAQCHCDIVACMISKDSENRTVYTPYPNIGMAIGTKKSSSTNDEGETSYTKFSNVKIGGRIATSATIDATGNIVGEFTNLTETNYFDYGFGERGNLTELSGVSYLASKEAIDYGSFGVK